MSKPTFYRRNAMRSWSTSWLLWGCIAAILLWLLIVLKISNRVNLADIQQPSHDITDLLTRLEGALKEVRDLKSENHEIKALLKSANQTNRISYHERQAEQAVLVKPLEHPKSDLYTKNHEIARRDLDNLIRELFFYVYDQVHKHENNADFTVFGKRVINQSISLMSQSLNFGTLVDETANWHRIELQKLTDHIQKRIYNIQHPESCSKVNVLVCDLNKGCGFGCQLHHVGYCLTVAAASNRTLVLDRDGDGWRYSKHGWTAVFEEISSCKYVDAVPSGTHVEAWNSVDQTERVTSLTIVEALQKRPAQLPLSFPKELADQLLTHHSYPPVFFVGQFVWYLMRSNQHMQEILSKAASHIPFGEGPIVGLQIRRTDKIGTEAAYHSVEEYVRWAEVWFQVQERRFSPPRKIKRRVFIATDDPNAVKEAKEKFPDYEVYADEGIAKSAQVANRYTDASLYGVVTDVRMLSKCDFLVCTFSSQVCRVGYELMQIEKGDAGDWFHSLDDVYYYGGQHAHDQVAIEPHEAANSEEIDLKVGDMIGIAGNHWDGFSKGTNRRTGKYGLYPSYKVRENWRIVDFPIFAL
ncbi:hypothetical protein M3Y94_00084800 [Aphelenchoides besseyi]|nr:hypothetical protein M3Y94_00084800 [Aphelenchoides besseyi]KAI6237745.1 hypothetical protein M3Y95_00297400 [Aphelenchoides besseyi]